MTPPGREPQSPVPLMNTLLINVKNIQNIKTRYKLLQKSIKNCRVELAVGEQT